jgi:3-phenylpropionate/trans-cinnamate dioxygenase ferredoxin subunit
MPRWPGGRSSPLAETVTLCKVDELAPGAARRFDVDGYRIALVRIGDEFHAINDECSHEDYSLSEGEVWPEECEIECPRHGSTFDLVTGEACSLPATQPVAVYPVDVADGIVSVVLP